MKTANCDIKTCFLCKNCTPAWRELVALRKEIVSFKKGDVLFKEGDAVTGIYFLHSGAVKVQKNWTGDKDLIIRFCKPGDIVGHRGLTPDAKYPVTAIALAQSEACYITTGFLETTLKADPGFMYQLLHFYSAELQKTEVRMRNLALADVRARIAETLLELLTTFGKNKNQYITVPVTRQDIAAYAGTTYETVFKILKTLVTAKIISTSGKSIRINDETKLRKLFKTAK